MQGVNMGNRTNIDYIGGTSARRIDSVSNEALIVSYDCDANDARKNAVLFCGDQTSQINGQSKCVTQPSCEIITKAQYLFGALFCFAGSILTYYLGILF